MEPHSRCEGGCPVEQWLAPEMENRTLLSHYHSPLVCHRDSKTAISSLASFPLLRRSLVRPLPVQFFTPSLTCRAFKSSPRTLAPMGWSLRVVAPLTADTEPTIVLVCDQPPKKYIFNSGEGTTRACVQKRFGIAKTAAILVTHLNTQQLGGFPGAFLIIEHLEG